MRGERRCIYCKSLLVGKQPTEHVIPLAFTGGFGGNNLTIRCVCHDCNSYFDRELDRVLAEDTFLGMLRYLEGVKADTRKAPLPARDRTRVSIKGQPLELSASPDGVGYACTTVPAVLPDPDSGKAVVNLEVSELQDRTARRCIAKIAFNYLAYVVATKHRGRTDLVLSPAFDTARCFIRLPDATPEPRCLLAHARLGQGSGEVVSRTAPRGHFATLQSSAGRNDIVGHVQLLSWWYWRVTLAEDYPGDARGVHVTHFWDLSSKTVRIVHAPIFRESFGKAPSWAGGDHSE
jgi:hypothetical protein